MPNSPGTKRNYRSEYDSYHGKPSQIKKRAGRVKARREMEKSGKVSKGDGKDINHRDGNPRNNSSKNLQVTSKKANRSFPRTKTAAKRKS